MKLSIDLIFRVAVIMLLLLQQAGIQYFYNKADKFEMEAVQTKEFYKEKETIREVNAQGQMRATVEIDELSIKLFDELMENKLQKLASEFNSTIDKSSSKVHSMTDMTITTRLAGLKMAKMDTTIQVITVIGDTTSHKGKVGYYTDGYNQFSIMDNGETYEMLPGSMVRNDITSVLYEGQKERWFLFIPKFWHKKPYLSETYSFNPLAGIDTVRAVVVPERIQKRKPN